MSILPLLAIPQLANLGLSAGDAAVDAIANGFSDLMAKFGSEENATTPAEKTSKKTETINPPALSPEAKALAISLLREALQRQIFQFSDAMKVVSANKGLNLHEGLTLELNEEGAQLADDHPHTNMITTLLSTDPELQELVTGIESLASQLRNLEQSAFAPLGTDTANGILAAAPDASRILLELNDRGGQVRFAPKA